jgi:hypothetical protein
MRVGTKQSTHNQLVWDSSAVLEDLQRPVQFHIDCQMNNSTTGTKHDVGKSLNVSQSDKVLRCINFVFLESFPNDFDRLSFSSSNLQMKSANKT